VGPIVHRRRVANSPRREQSNPPWSLTQREPRPPVGANSNAPRHRRRPPEFEVATLKRSPPPEGDTININLGTVRNGKLTLANASLSDCLKFAYNIGADAQISSPDWVKSKELRFDIVAQPPSRTPTDQLPLMLQTLLADRLKLAVHREKNELSYLALVQGKNGPKFHVSTAPAAPGTGTHYGGRIIDAQISMPKLALLLSRFERQTVLDQTGLDGFYDLKLEWAPDGTKDNPGPSLYTAVQEQLGLKLEGRKGPVEIIVVDNADKVPTDN
jgi:uncharacterized protein (TIGR03435 family)